MPPRPGEDDGVDLMNLVMNPEICVFCNALEHKDNSRCRLEASPTRSQPTAHGHGQRIRASGIGIRDAACGCAGRPFVPFGKAPVVTGNPGHGPQPPANGHRARPRTRASGIGRRDAACGCCGTARGPFGKAPVVTGNPDHGHRPRSTATATGHSQRPRPRPRKKQITDQIDR